MYYAIEHKTRLDPDTLEWSTERLEWAFKTKAQRDAVCSAKPAIYPAKRADCENPQLAAIEDRGSFIRLRHA